MGENNQKETMNDLYEQYDVKSISTGDILKGEVIDVNNKEAIVNINYAFDGIISKEELALGDVNPKDVVKVGDKLEVYVLTPNNGEGYVLLSRIRVLSIRERDELKKAFKKQSNIKVDVKELVKGGLAAYYGNTRIFIPGSLASLNKIDLSKLVGTELEVRLNELDFKNRKVVASRKVIEEEIYNADLDKKWNALVEGEKVSGVVKKILNIGAIIDINGIQGLAHKNDLSWERIKRVEDVVKVGDNVEVYIGTIDKENRKVSLILKEADQEPWKLYGDSIRVGDVLEGKVTKFMKFGAFVEIFPTIEGLVHLSEITDENITKADEILKLGQKVKVKVLDYKKDAKRISLSIRETEEKSKEYLQYNDEEEGVSLGELFKDLL